MLEDANGELAKFEENEAFIKLMVLPPVDIRKTVEMS